MQFDHIARAGPLMQAVDILSNQRKVRKALLPVSNSGMPRIWLHTFQQVTPVIKPFPNGRQIALDHADRRNKIERYAFPNCCLASATKGWHAGFGRDTRACQDQHNARAHKSLSQFLRNQTLIDRLHRCSGW